MAYALNPANRAPAPSRRGRAINVRLDDDLYDALVEASDFRDFRTVSDAVRAACAQFVASAAADDLPVRELAARHAALKARAEQIAERDHRLNRGTREHATRSHVGRREAGAREPAES